MEKITTANKSNSVPLIASIDYFMLVLTSVVIRPFTS